MGCHSPLVLWCHKMPTLSISMVSGHILRGKNDKIAQKWSQKDNFFFKNSYRLDGVKTAFKYMLSIFRELNFIFK